VVAGKYYAIKRAWSTAGDKVEIDFDFRLRCWVQPFPSPHTDDDDEDEDDDDSHSMCLGCSGAAAIADSAALVDELEASDNGDDSAAGVVVAAAAAAALPPPKPLWSSAWPLNGKTFNATTQLVVSTPQQQAIGDGPTTMMGWVCPFMSGEEEMTEMIPFSFGAKMGAGAATDDCRALSIMADDANYYMRGGAANVFFVAISTLKRRLLKYLPRQARDKHIRKSYNKVETKGRFRLSPAGPYDSTAILGSAKTAWAAAWKDSEYHHVAISDTGTSFTLYLDGKALVTNTQHINRKQRMNTAAGFVVGGWADENRRWNGALAGQ
jgi:hypothetical protein